MALLLLLGTAHDQYFSQEQDMPDLPGLNAHIEKYLRPSSFPVAVKLLDDEKSFSNGQRPVGLCGHPLALCQGLAMARRFGWKLVFHRQDWACPVGMYAFGFGEKTGAGLDAEIAYPLYTATPEAGVRLQHQMPRLAGGKARTILMAGLHRTDFDPDVVIVYGGPYQIARCIQAGIWKDGGVIASAFPGRMACAYEIICPVQDGGYQVVVPGGGERAYAGTQDHEMGFAVPANKFSNFAQGLAATHKAGANRIPTPLLGIKAKPCMPPQYANLGAWVGMEPQAGEPTPISQRRKKT